MTPRRCRELQGRFLRKGPGASEERTGKHHAGQHHEEVSLLDRRRGEPVARPPEHLQAARRQTGALHHDGKERLADAIGEYLKTDFGFKSPRFSSFIPTRKVKSRRKTWRWPERRHATSTFRATRSRSSLAPGMKLRVSCSITRMTTKMKDPCCAVPVSRMSDRFPPLFAPREGILFDRCVRILCERLRTLHGYPSAEVLVGH